MTCFAPKQAFRSVRPNKSGKFPILFSADFQDSNPLEPLKVPCGYCQGCRFDYAREKGVRCHHEAQMNDGGYRNCFITLTYDNKFLPKYGSLDTKAWRDFYKRLKSSVCYRVTRNAIRDGVDRDTATALGRWTAARIRMFMGPEYGDKNGRPHYHAIIFNFRFPDLRFDRERRGHKLYRSAWLERLWPYGYSSVGEVTFESASYVARYMMKKVKGKDQSTRYWRVADFETGEMVEIEPEKARMSQSIGKHWFAKFKDDLYPDDFVVLPKGNKVSVPRFYDKLLESVSPDLYSSVKASRVLKAKAYNDVHGTPERLRVRRLCFEAKFRQFSKELDCEKENL